MTKPVLAVLVLVMIIIDVWLFTTAKQLLDAGQQGSGLLIVFGGFIGLCILPMIAMGLLALFLPWETEETETYHPRKSKSGWKRVGWKIVREIADEIFD